MATSTVIPVSEYLRTMYRPDRDYVDDHIEERHVGELDHSLLQGQFLRLLWAERFARHVLAIQELRVQVSATRYRIPDVCVRPVSAPREQILRTPPLLCIEVLSPKDTLTRMRKRVQDFFAMGVPEAWIVDGVHRVVYVCTATEINEHSGGVLAVPGTSETIAIADVFSVLDRS